ncbi:diuretic hormone receptor-like isoform X2 [Harmonia axyridis]|uniref:diuretic hormone receptor-like isoform X2 n=1 Tax=Harmonia axyridis TaxID=115357 RepID=UPI001E277595|nr:diuretic hormone receptor-like isoform X2 [Harmonia axyridis]
MGNDLSGLEGPSDATSAEMLRPDAMDYPSNATVDLVDYVAAVNQTGCEELYANETLAMTRELSTLGFCGPMADPVACWPPTPVNTTAVIRCFAELNFIRYDDSQNASRFCMWNGTWTKSNYSACKEIFNVPPDVETSIYFVGYTFGLISLSVAVGIFTYFKELRCLRNTIHMNLMWSYMLTYTMWIITLISLNTSFNVSVPCVFIITLLHYFHITTFFWMFVEGLYLYILVVETLTRENFKLRIYLLIGWVFPLCFIAVWAILKSFISTEDDPANSCDWFNPHLVDWIFQAPQVAVLLLNLIFLVAIMWVLVTKLRSANTVETQQYHKAAKALLVLMPLLGVTYVITIWAPTPDADSKRIFERARAVLLSLQGFTVALLYCFLNTEVQNAVRHHLATWKTRRSLGPNRLRSGSRSKDWSPRSRTESIRFTEWSLVPPDDIEPGS